MTKIEKLQREPQTVATASAVLADLEAALLRHRERAVELEAARKRASFGAFAEGDRDSRKALADVVDQAIRHETVGRAIADAIEEAQRRLAIATAYEADVADRAKAKAALEVLGAFKEAGREMDDACRSLGETGRLLGSLLSQLHAAGIRSPSRDRLDALGYQAFATALMATPWAKRYEHLAPNQRRSFRTLVDGWAAPIESRLRAQLGEQEEEAA